MKKIRLVLLLAFLILFISCASYKGYGSMGAYTVVGEGYTLKDARNSAKSSLWGIKSSYTVENEWAIRNPWAPETLYVYGITIRFQAIDLDKENFN